MSIEEEDVGGGVPVEVTTPGTLPKAEVIHVEPKPLEEGQPKLMDDDIDDAVDAIDIAPQVVQTVAPQIDEPLTPTQEAVEGSEGQDEEGKDPDGSLTLQQTNIWDECDELFIDPKNIENVKPMFEREKGDVDITLPPTTLNNMNVLGKHRDIQTDRDYIWMLEMGNADLVTPPDEIRLKRLQREGSDWMQNVPIERDGKGPNRLAFLMPAPKTVKGQGVKLTGQSAVDSFMTGTTLGTPVTVPLVNTGIWVKLSPASASFLSELDRQLAFARLQLGLDYNGIHGSTDDLIFREIINEAALKLVTACNYPVTNPLDLREVIDDEDRATLAWALAKVLYPKGIMVSIPCLDPKCGEINTFRANPARMHFIDRSKLSPKQQQYLARGIARPMTLEEINDYKSEFKVARRSVTIDGREFFFRTPTIAEKIQIGRGYLASANQAIDTAMASTPDDDMKRSNVMEQVMAVENVCRYAHYISEIRIYNAEDNGDGDYAVIEEEDDIRSILKTISNSEDFTDQLIEAIEDFLVEIGAAIVGYFNVSCNKCDYKDVPEKLKNRLILPFDPETGFFILAQRKISLARGRVITDLTTFGVANLEQTALAQLQQESFDPSIY